MTDLDKAREIINEVDKELGRLFEKRMDAVRLVAKYKKEQYNTIFYYISSIILCHQG